MYGAISQGVKPQSRHSGRVEIHYLLEMLVSVYRAGQSRRQTAVPSYRARQSQHAFPPRVQWALGAAPLSPRSIRLIGCALGRFHPTPALDARLVPLPGPAELHTVGAPPGLILVLVRVVVLDLRWRSGFGFSFGFTVWVQFLGLGFNYDFWYWFWF